MKKILIASLMLMIVSLSPLAATIIPTTKILKIKEAILDDPDALNPDTEKKTLFLFNIAEVLMDSSRSLGTSAWRKYIRSKVDAKTHDMLTLYIAEHVPSTLPEKIIPVGIHKLQELRYPVLGFTSRGRSEWYSTKIEGVDSLTESLLFKNEIYLELSYLPQELQALESLFADSYHGGILYAGNHIEKGEFLKKVLIETGYRPSKIVFVDDKIDSLKTVEAAMEEMGIPFFGYAYNKTAMDHQDFDPMIAHIQLEWLLLHNTLLTDAEAAQIKEEKFQGVEADQYFYQLIERIDFSALGEMFKSPIFHYDVFK